MKRANNIISSFLCAIIMSLSLVACSNDSKDEPNASQAKKISSILFSEDDETEQTDYVYDSTGRIISSTWTASDGGYEMITYTYENSKIVSTSTDGCVQTYFLNDGLVYKYTQEWESSPFSSFTTYYSYDADRKLSTIKNDSNHQTEIQSVEWEDGNIISIEGSTYTYSDIPSDKGYGYYNNIDWVLYSQGYFGVCSKNLYTSETRYDRTEVYHYELKDGYVVKASIENGSTMTLKWQ